MSIFSKLQELTKYDNTIAEKKKQVEFLSTQIGEKALAANKLVDAIKELEQNRETLYQGIYSKAQQDALADVTAQLQQKNSELTEIIGHISDNKEALSDLADKVTTSNKEWISLTKRIEKIKITYRSIANVVKNYYSGALTDNNVILAQGQSLDGLTDDLSPTVALTLQCMSVKQLRARFKQNEKLIGEVLAKYKGRYTTKANLAIYSLMVIALEAELQNVLYNLSYGKVDKSLDAVKAITAKYLKLATEGNQNIAGTMVKFIGEIEYLFLEAVQIEYEYYVQKERIKEEQRALREQMRQEAEERRLLEQQRALVEKEESKYRAEMASVTELLTLSVDPVKTEQLVARLSVLENQLNEVEAKKEDIINLQNGRAGYVYVISNLGSFGDDVFKIGMTRRLEPQERINELGDASVPFPFDVHSMIFSDNAVGLEYSIHQALTTKRLNRVNLRKEFFKVSLDELEELVYGYEPTCEFKRTMLAEQYNQSLSISADALCAVPVADEVDESEDEALDEVS